MTELWQDLKIGDRVRFVRLPEGITDKETRAVYEALIAAGAVLLIDEVDDFGHPWTEPFEIDATGTITTGSGIGHALALNDESWERVILWER
jgi:hypothetical protein